MTMVVVEKEPFYREVEGSTLAKYFASSLHQEVVCNGHVVQLFFGSLIQCKLNLLVYGCTAKHAFLYGKSAVATQTG